MSLYMYLFFFNLCQRPWPYLDWYVFHVFVASLVKRLKMNMKMKIRCLKVLLWTKKNITTALEFVVYKFERSAAPLMGIWICIISDKINRWTFSKFYSRGSASSSNSSLLNYFFIFNIWEVSNLLIYFSNAWLK